MKLGKYDLEFSESGKLRSLSICDCDSVLYDCEEICSFENGYNYVPAGWDECFPTIDPYGSWPAMGSIVYSKPKMVTGQGCFTMEWSFDRFAASRIFRTDSAGELEIIFSVVNRSNRPISFLWASHPLFKLNKLRGVTLADGSILKDFHPDGTCRKFFVSAAKPVIADYDEMILSLATDQPYWGIWLNRGGWLSGNFRNINCIGIEATNCCGETPDGRSMLKPNQIFTGTVMIELNLKNMIPIKGIVSKKESHQVGSKSGAIDLRNVL